MRVLFKVWVYDSHFKENKHQKRTVSHEFWILFFMILLQKIELLQINCFLLYSLDKNKCCFLLNYLKHCYFKYLYQYCSNELGLLWLLLLKNLVKKLLLFKQTKWDITANRLGPIFNKNLNNNVTIFKQNNFGNFFIFTIRSKHNMSMSWMALFQYCIVFSFFIYD